MKATRLGLFTLGLVSLVFFVTAVAWPGRVLGMLQFNAEIQAFDALMLYIEPPVYNLTTQCEPLMRYGGIRGGPFILYVASNTSTTSSLQFYTEKEGYYNITVGFWSPSRWRFRVGVLTANPKLYASSVVERSGTAYFVELVSGVNEAGNYTLAVQLHTQGVEKTNPFSLELPSPLNSALFLAVTLPLAYVNVFAATDSYFKNKSEGISRQRKVGLALMVVCSILLIYYVYSSG